MFVESLQDLACPCCISSTKVELDNFEPIMHARDEEVGLARLKGMPLDPPCAAANVDLRQRRGGLSGIEKPDGAIVTSDSEDMFHVGMALDRCHPGIEPETIQVRRVTVESNAHAMAYRLFVNMGSAPPCRTSQPFILRSSPPGPSLISCDPIARVDKGSYLNIRRWYPNSPMRQSMVRNHAHAKNQLGQLRRPQDEAGRENHWIGRRSCRLGRWEEPG